MEEESYIKKSILWDITRMCNLNCTHCYNSGGKWDKQEIDIISYHKMIVDKIIRAGFNHIHLLGGEPLMVKGLFDLLYYAYKKNVVVSINTNGTLLKKEIIDELIKLRVSQLTISVDGSSELTNDSIRGIGNYKKVTENIKQTISCIEQVNSKMLIQVAAVITKQNISTIHRLPEILQNIGVKYLNILKLYECGNAANNEKYLKVKNEEYLEALCKLRIESYRKKIYTQFDCKPKVLELINLKYGFPCEKNFEFASCNAGKKIFFMDYKGDIYPCGPFSQEVLDNELCTSIFEENYLKNLLNIEKGINKRIEQFCVELDPICSNCQYNKCCGGCAICNKRYYELCETAIHLYSS